MDRSCVPHLRCDHFFIMMANIPRSLRRCLLRSAFGWRRPSVARGLRRGTDEMWNVMVALLCIALAGCAPQGYHYGTWSVTDPAQAFRLQPNDACRAPEMTSVGALQWLNSRMGQAGGPPRTVVAIQNLRGASFQSGASISCHCTIVMADGLTQTGTLSFSDPGGSAPLQVSWLSDADRDKPAAWQVAIQDRCHDEPGNYSLCVNNRTKQHIQCLLLQQDALGTMSTLQGAMKSFHATPEQVVAGDIAGINEWHPTTGPYWEPAPNPISYSDRKRILDWAVAMANSTNPREFADAVLNRCLSEQ